MTIYGLDVSEYNVNSKGEPFPVHLMKDQGYEFLTARCSIGTTPDRLYDHFRNRCHLNKIPFAAYHYVKAHVLAGEKADEIQPWHQARMVEQQLGHSRIPLMVDYEEGSFCHVQQFIQACLALGINVQSFYYPKWKWEADGKPNLERANLGGVALVNSNYGNNPHAYGSVAYPGDNTVGWEPYGTIRPTILQFGSKIKLDNYDRSLDGNAYKGSLSQLRSSGLFHYWTV